MKIRPVDIPVAVEIIEIMQLKHIDFYTLKAHGRCVVFS